MHNARKGEFTLPMANRKSSANIRQETFFEPERLSPFLEKCVDEKYCIRFQKIVKIPWAMRRVRSFISEDICRYFQLPAGSEIDPISNYTYGEN